MRVEYGPLKREAAGTLRSISNSMRLNSSPSANESLISSSGMYCSSAWMVA
jgi:hypothetical protein